MAYMTITYAGKSKTVSVRAHIDLLTANKYCTDNITITRPELPAGIATASAQASTTSLTFSGLLGKPINFYIKLNNYSSAITHPSSGTNYYITAIKNGTAATTTYLSSSSVKTGNYTNGSTTYLRHSSTKSSLTVSTTAGIKAAPGHFISGATYTLMYSYDE